MKINNIPKLITASSAFIFNPVTAEEVIGTENCNNVGGEGENSYIAKTRNVIL